jgi:hypothetical protein
VLCGLTKPAAAQLTNLPPDCANPPAYNYTIGNPLTTTLYSGGYTFPVGNYHVVGNLLFKGGAFTISPGTKFYIDGTNAVVKGVTRVTGYTLYIGENAHLEANGAVFTAACNNNLSPAQGNMWQGIWFESNQTGQELMLEGCSVANAMYGVLVSGAGTLSHTHYEIRNTHFEQNYYHIYDEGRHQSSTNNASVLADLTLYSQPSLLAPFGANPYESWTYEALHLRPSGLIDGAPEVVMSGTNTIEGAIYGVVANAPGQGELRFDGYLNVRRINRIGVWLDDTSPIVSYPIQTTINMNDGIITPRTYRTRWTLPAEHMYGVVGAVHGTTVPLGLITVTGTAGADTSTSKAQTGVFFDQAGKPITNLTLTNLTYGLSLREGSSDVVGNTFASCWHGLRMRSNTILAAIPSRLLMPARRRAFWWTPAQS